MSGRYDIIISIILTKYQTTVFWIHSNLQSYAKKDGTYPSRPLIKHDNEASWSTTDDVG